MNKLIITIIAFLLGVACSWALNYFFNIDVVLISIISVFTGLAVYRLLEGFTGKEV